MEDSDLQSTRSVIIGSNDDLLTEILIHLPVISILRFKSVSKHWRSLLSNGRFTHRYDNNNFSKSVGLFAGNIYVPFDVENPSPPPFRSLGFYFNRSDVRIEQSCNGLLLCHAIHNDNDNGEYYVFNPTTKQLAFIPPVPVGHTRFMALAFHQTHCVHYKVVSVCPLEPHENMFQIQVYSSDTGKWKVCVESFSSVESVFRDPVYWNGAVYWSPFSSNILYYKLDVERLQSLSLPEEYLSSAIVAMYFGESRGHLHLILHNNNQCNSLHVNVYEMLSDHSGWFVKYQVQLEGLLSAFPEVVSPYGYDFEVVDVVRGEVEEEDTFMVLLTPGKIIRYNAHDKSFKELYSHTSYFFEEFTSFHRYIQTLSSF